jgi:asparagine synthase (glutamine-hydrolysing)
MEARSHSCAHGHGGDGVEYRGNRQVDKGVEYVCGVLGLFETTSEPAYKVLVANTLKTLRHRGPDDFGVENYTTPGGALHLGHTRLSIIDLTAAGHQPMTSSDGRLTIVFNGELYNYRELRGELRGLGHFFRSQSDTEVLLACWSQWGEACLGRLRGMFAFAIYDGRLHTLTGVRDAFGIKPLYFSSGSRHFAFASETDALRRLMPSKPALNWQAAYNYLALGKYDAGADTFFDGVEQLQPGHLFSLSLNEPGNSPLIRRWWSPSIEERTDMSLEDAADHLREMFLASVKMHLRSDVPLAAALSGGIDSSAIVCAMRHLEPETPILTFSYVSSGSEFDEESWADLVTENVEATPHKVRFTSVELERDIDDLLLTQGEPFGGTSIYAQYRVYKHAQEHGVKVMLDGQGADELFAGYQGYPAARLASMFSKRDLASFMRFSRGWPRYPGRSNMEYLRQLGFALAPNSLLASGMSLVGRSTTPPWIRSQLLRDRGVRIGPTPKSLAPIQPGRHLADTLRSAMTGGGLAPLLRHGDRNSMRWSVESRVPFLTQDIAEFALSLPEHYLVSQDGETKNVLRRAMRGIVPKAVLARRDKIGFRTAETALLRDLGDTVFDWIDAGKDLPFIDTLLCHAHVRRAIDGTSSAPGAVWRMVNYCRWAQIAEVA